MNTDIKDLFKLAGFACYHGLKGYALFINNSGAYIYEYKTHDVYTAVELLNVAEQEGMVKFNVQGTERIFIRTNRVVAYREFFTGLCVMRVMEECKTHLDRFMNPMG